MNYVMAAIEATKPPLDRTKTNTWFCILDRASIHTLLIYFSYSDINNLIKVRPYVRKFVSNSYFMKEWKKYNVKTITGPGDDPWSHTKTNEMEIKTKKKHGQECGYNRDGNVIYRHNYVNGHFHGKQFSWSDDGRLLSERTFKHGKATGLDTNWYHNGKRQFQCTYVSGKHHGLLTRWHRNGNKEYEVMMKNGEHHGSAKRWTFNGKLISSRY